MTLRPDTYRLHNGEKATAQFSTIEYETRLAGLRAIMATAGVKTAIFTSMHSIAYYSGFLYCAFGRPYGLVVTATKMSPFPQVSTLASLGGDPLVTISPIPTGNAIISGAPFDRLLAKTARLAMKAII